MQPAFLRGLTYYLEFGLPVDPPCVKLCVCSCSGCVVLSLDWPHQANLLGSPGSEWE